jgi:hypothetical protein
MCIFRKRPVEKNPPPSPRSSASNSAGSDGSDPLELLPIMETPHTCIKCDTNHVINFVAPASYRPSQKQLYNAEIQLINNVNNIRNVFKTEYIAQSKLCGRRKRKSPR